MLVHLCDECGKVSINRIAADDDPATLLEMLERSQKLDERMRSALAQNAIVILGAGHVLLVREQLLGRAGSGGAHRKASPLPRKDLCQME